MTLRHEVFRSDEWAGSTASHIAAALPSSGSVVLTGGSTAREVYPVLADLAADWSKIEVLFSDERCVPPAHPESNFRMAKELLFEVVRPKSIHRMRGEDDPETAATAYHKEMAALVDTGIDLLLLGMGADCHIGAIFPGSPALTESVRLCAAVDRPDGLKGLTLTPPAMLGAKRILLLVTGSNKAAAVARVVSSTEPVETCPAAMLRGHPDAMFLLDEDSATALSRRSPPR